MKHSAEYRKFTGLVDRVLPVPHEEMQRQVGRLCRTQAVARH